MIAPRVVLFLVGAALSIAQFVMIRDFVSILYGEEVVIVLVTASFFLGLSAGYLLAPRLSNAAFKVLFAASTFLHLTFPFSYRYIAAWFSAIDVGGYAFLGLLFGYALLFNALFATFLPRLIALPDNDLTTEAERLRTYYGLELLGFMSGFLVVALSWNRPAVFVLGPYWLILAVLLYLVLQRKALTATFASVAMCLVIFLGPLDKHSTGLLYAHKHSIRNAEVLFSINSPYQKVEVIENHRGTRYLYLDGLQNLNSTDLDALNYFIAELPAALIRPAETLLIGNGTLSSVSKVYPHSGYVTTVELDPSVLEAGRQFFTPPASLSGLEHWELHVDDGKHFLRSSNDRYDLIVVDVPSPLTIQEAYLHTMEFYALANERLTENGVLAVQLSGELSRNDRTPARVTAALRAVFPEVMVVSSDRADRSFAYASRALPFSASQLRAASSDYDAELKVVLPDAVDGYLTRTKPMSLNAMDLVLRRGWERFRERYF